MRRLIILGVIIICSLVVTTLAIDASDTFSGRGGTLLARVLPNAEVICPLGMTHFPAALSFTCVDTYEAAPGPDCSIENPQNQFQTEANISQRNCQPVSVDSSLPWRYVSREQARELCTKAGKRLPSVAEWYEFAIGTDVGSCVVDGDEPLIGERQLSCVSAGGVVGAVGNVWEWVSDDVQDGLLEGKSLPSSGRVLSVDSAGVATLTAEAASSTLPGYFWSEPKGQFGIIRGGFYGSRNDAGVYALHAHTATQFTGAGVGFRCIR